MIWCVVGLLFIQGDPISVRVCDYKTRGDCFAARMAIYRSAFAHAKTGAFITCKEYRPET